MLDLLSGKWNCCSLPLEHSLDIFICYVDVIVYHVTESKIVSRQEVILCFLLVHAMSTWQLPPITELLTSN